MLLNFITDNIVEPIVQSQLLNGTIVFQQFTEYAKDTSTNNLLLPKTVYNAKFPNSLPNLSGIGTLERKFSFDYYDNKGNVTQYTTDSGTTVSVLWGYNQTQPIAKIENATNAQIASALGVSNLSTVNEGDLTAINSLRSNATLSNAMITTYSYLPLVGVNTITDPKGDITTYIYDAFGRLLSVNDKDGKIISEYEYNYKSQN